VADLGDPQPLTSERKGGVGGIADFEPCKYHYCRWKTEQDCN
jgi:hypothetical protein